MKFDTLNTSCSLSSICLPIGQMFQKWNLLLPITLLSPAFFFGSDICVSIYPFLFLFLLCLSFFRSLLLFYLFLVIDKKNNQNSEDAFDGIKTKYEFRSVVCVLVYPLFHFFHILPDFLNLLFLHINNAIFSLLKDIFLNCYVSIFFLFSFEAWSLEWKW